MIIKEYGPGGVYIGSKYFVETPEGYAKARNEIERITSLGHRTGINREDDSGKVSNFWGGLF